jgi:NifU-like protein
MKKNDEIFSWYLFSKKVIERILFPKNIGFFSQEDADAKSMRLVRVQEGGIRLGNEVHLYWLIDMEDGIVADAKFQVFGPPALIAAADAACDLVIRKNYEQARRISADLIDRHLRSSSGKSSFPKEVAQQLNLVLFAIEEAANACMDIPIDEVYVAPPIDQKEEEVKAYPGWESLPRKEQIDVIEEVIQAEIRPYIELDAGGVKIVELKENGELVIAYEGACTSCYSATGATLSAIQNILQKRVHPSICVVPDLSFLTASTSDHSH